MIPNEMEKQYDSVLEKKVTLGANPLIVEGKFKNGIDYIVSKRKQTDNVYQFFTEENSLFEQVLADVIDSYFGSTSGFFIEYVLDLKMYGLLAQGQREAFNYNVEHHVSGFLNVLETVLIDMFSKE